MNHLGGQGYFEFWTRWQQEEPCLYGNLFLLCTRWKPHRDLEIEHVSPIVASVYSHMLNGHWLSQLHWEDPCIGLQVNWNEGTWNPTLVPEDKLALCMGGPYGKTSSHSQSAGTPSWWALIQWPLVATRWDCDMWVKCTTSAEDNKI